MKDQDVIGQWVYHKEDYVSTEIKTYSSIKKKQMSPWNFNDFDAVDKIYDHHKIFSSGRSKFYLKRFLE